MIAHLPPIEWTEKQRDPVWLRKKNERGTQREAEMKNGKKLH